MSMLEKAIGIALEVHSGKKDKAGAAYVLHPLRVMLRMENEAEMMVGVLHDVIEDGADQRPRLEREGFPREVLEALDFVSRREGEAYEDYIVRVKGNPLAVRVKLADLLDNMDVRRFSVFTEKEQERLARYLRAWKTLSETAKR